MSRYLEVMFKRGLLLFITFLISSISAEDKRWVKAIKNGDTKLSVRTRLEMVDQDGLDRDATAQTIRTRLSYLSRVHNNWRLNVEFDNVSSLVEDYNSTVNGNIRYPVVADPEGADLNQVNMHYKTEDYSLKIGRQRLNINNQRIVGGVGWRQNEQTFDSISVDFRSTSELWFGYSYIHNVNRIFGPSGAASDILGDHHLLTANYQISKNHKFVFTGLLFDPEKIPSIGHSTSLFEYQGSLDSASVRLSYAIQSESSRAPIDYQADYQLIEFGYDFEQISAKIGFEVLGSDDGIAAFTTPLATLHKFQGFADKFLQTPLNGIEDIYFSISSSFDKFKVSAAYHDYNANFGNASYGDEFNLVGVFKANKMFQLVLKYATYNSEGFQTDTDKLWLMTMTTF